MEKEQIINDMLEQFRACDGNVIRGKIALEGCEGPIMFDEPVFGISAADDDIYKTFKKPEVIGENFLLPEDWLRKRRVSSRSFCLSRNVSEVPTEAIRRTLHRNGCMPGLRGRHS